MSGTAKRRADRPGASAPPDGGVRGAILAAAVDLFFKRGYEATSVNDVVELAGYTKGAFYHYFKSKEALLLEIHDAFVSRGVRKGEQILAGGHSPTEALRLLIRELLHQVAVERPQMTIVLHEARYMSFDKYPESKRRRDQYEGIVVTILERGIGAEAFRQDLASTRIVSFGIMGMCVWAYQWLSSDGAFSTDEIAEMYTTVILDGLVPKPRAA